MLSPCHGGPLLSPELAVSPESLPQEAGHASTGFHVNYLRYHRNRGRFYQKPRAKASRFSSLVKRRKACGELGAILVSSGFPGINFSQRRSLANEGVEEVTW